MSKIKSNLGVSWADMSDDEEIIIPNKPVVSLKPVDFKGIIKNLTDERKIIKESIREKELDNKKEKEKKEEEKREEEKLIREEKVKILNEQYQILQQFSLDALKYVSVLMKSVPLKYLDSLNSGGENGCMEGSMEGGINIEDVFPASNLIYQYSLLKIKSLNMEYDINNLIVPGIPVACPKTIIPSKHQLQRIQLCKSGFQCRWFKQQAWLLSKQQTSLPDELNRDIKCCTYLHVSKNSSGFKLLDGRIAIQSMIANTQIDDEYFLPPGYTNKETIVIPTPIFNEVCSFDGKKYCRNMIMDSCCGRIHKDVKTIVQSLKIKAVVGETKKLTGDDIWNLSKTLA